MQHARERARGSGSEDEEYTGDDDGHHRTTRRLRQLELRGRAGRSPKEEAVRAANEAATEEVPVFAAHRQARTGSDSGEDTGQISEAEGVVMPIVPEDAADNLYAIHQKNFMRQYLRRWRTATIRKTAERRHRGQQAMVFYRWTLLRQAFDQWQEKAWYAKVERQAETYYNRGLALRVWSTWVHQTAAILHRTDELRERMLIRKYSNAWRRVVMQRKINEREALRFQLGVVWDRWIANYHKRKELEKKAIAHYNEGVVTRAYWVWYYEICVKLFTATREDKLLKVAIDGWVQKTENAIRLAHMADAFFRRRTLQSVFAHWAKKTEENLERQDLAYDYSEWRLMHSHFDTWKRSAIMAPRVRALTDYHNDRLTSDFLFTWRERTKMSVAASELYRQSALRRAVTRWRLVLRMRVVQENHDTRLKERALQNWALQERYQLLRRTNDRRLARRVMHTFCTNLVTKAQRLRQSYEDAAILRNRYLAHSALTCWTFKLDRIQSMSRHAELRFEATVCSKALVLWKGRTQTYAEYAQWAQASVWYFTAKHVMAKLKSAYINARKNRLRQAYHYLVRQRKRNLAARAMDVWKRKLVELRDLESVAEHFDATRHEDLSQDILEHWRDRTAQVVSDNQRAEDFNTRRLLRLGMGKMLARHQSVRYMEQEADMRYQRETYKLLATFIRRWDTRYWDLTMSYERGERLWVRKEALRVKQILRQWRDAVKHPQEDVEQLPGFRESVMLPPPPMTALRRRVEMPGATPATPGFKTLRRGLLGNASMSQTPLGSPGSPLKRFAAFNLGRSMLGRVSEPGEEEEEGSVSGSATATFVGSRSTMDKPW